MGSQRWTNQLLRLEVELCGAPGIDRMRVTLPAAAPFSAEEGDPVELTLNSGEIEKAVFSGVIDSIRKWETGIEVTALDASGILARYRPSITYENVTPGSLIRALAADAGVRTGSIENGSELVCYVADPARTAWEHVARVSAWIGALVTVSEQNQVESKVVQTASADLALRYGREILAVERTRRAAPVQSFTVAGESGTGTASSLDAHRMVTDFFAGNRPDGPARSAIWEWQPALRTVSAAAMAGTARLRAYASARDAGKLTAILIPSARPGTVIQMQDAPDGLPEGPVWISRVRHRLTAEQAVSSIWFSDSGGPSAAGLLGSAASAVGSLL
jgi:hypothetical protein